MAFRSVTLLTLVVISLSVCVAGVPLSDFFPFGPETGDKSLPPSNDATASLTLKQPFPLYGQRRKQLTVRVHVAPPLITEQARGGGGGGGTDGRIIINNEMLQTCS